MPSRAATEWQYEPKWDGFRCLLSRQGDKVDLRSKSGEDLARYFPELVRAALELKATTFLLDGEIVVPHGKAFSFDDLLQRIHPAASRVKKLSQETPALFLVFDLLATAADKKLAASPLRERRPALEAFAKARTGSCVVWTPARARCFGKRGSRQARGVGGTRFSSRTASRAASGSSWPTNRASSWPKCSGRVTAKSAGRS